MYHKTYTNSADSPILSIQLIKLGALYFAHSAYLETKLQLHRTTLISYRIIGINGIAKNRKNSVSDLAAKDTIF